MSSPASVQSEWEDTDTSSSSRSSTEEKLSDENDAATPMQPKAAALSEFRRGGGAAQQQEPSLPAVTAPHSTSALTPRSSPEIYALPPNAVPMTTDAYSKWNSTAATRGLMPYEESDGADQTLYGSPERCRSTPLENNAMQNSHSGDENGSLPNVDEAHRYHHHDDPSAASTAASIGAELSGSPPMENASSAPSFFRASPRIFEIPKGSGAGYAISRFDESLELNDDTARSGEIPLILSDNVSTAVGVAALTAAACEREEQHGTADDSGREDDNEDRGGGGGRIYQVQDMRRRTQAPRVGLATTSGQGCSNRDSDSSLAAPSDRRPFPVVYSNPLAINTLAASQKPGGSAAAPLHLPPPLQVEITTIYNESSGGIEWLRGKTSGGTPKLNEAGRPCSSIKGIKSNRLQHHYRHQSSMPHPTLHVARYDRPLLVVMQLPSFWAGFDFFFLPKAILYFLLLLLEFFCGVILLGALRLVLLTMLALLFVCCMVTIADLAMLHGQVDVPALQWREYWRSA